MMGARFRDAGSVRPGYWFRPKRFGFGAVPVTWQGWAATMAFVALAGLLANLVTHRDRIWLVLFVPLVAAYLWLVAVKTDGGWGFRWGEDA
ncbi:hypothetical protein [Sphingomonas sp. R-74633]|uniref:hypothetical protein n=1 Tax=Sphingomonas sp. R-74633 TaxID=2751188 RepID=UPI0035A0620A